MAGVCSTGSDRERPSKGLFEATPHWYCAWRLVCVGSACDVSSHRQPLPSWRPLTAEEPCSPRNPPMHVCSLCNTSCAALPCPALLLLLRLLMLRLLVHPSSFFIVQLSSMITGWCAIAALTGPLPKGTSVFSAVLLKVAQAGTGQTVLSALLLASGGLQLSQHVAGWVGG